MNARRPDKYMVIKADVFDELQHKFRMNPNYLAAFQILQDNAIMDATVIRAQDVFAAPGLDAYAGVVQTAIELCRDVDGGIRHLWGIPIHELQDLADLFHERALEAHEAQNKKVPDL